MKENQYEGIKGPLKREEGLWGFNTVGLKYTNYEGLGHFHNIYDNFRGKMKDYNIFGVNIRQFDNNFRVKVVLCSHNIALCETCTAHLCAFL